MNGWREVEIRHALEKNGKNDSEVVVALRYVRMSSFLLTSTKPPSLLNIQYEKAPLAPPRLPKAMPGLWKHEVRSTNLMSVALRGDSRGKCEEAEPTIGCVVLVSTEISMQSCIRHPRHWFWTHQSGYSGEATVSRYSDAATGASVSYA